MKYLRYIRDWIFSIPTLLVFGLSLAFFDIVGRVALLFGLRPFEWVMVALQKCLLWSFLFSYVTIEVEKSPELVNATPYVLVSNHQSMLDVPMFGARLARSFPKYIAKKELSRWIPSVSLNLQKGGNALIDRDDRRQALGAIRKLAIESQERGTSIVIFPEGRRSRDGETLEFRSGGLAMVLRSAPEMAVVPAVIDGSWIVFRHRMFPVPFGTKVRVRFGAPIERTESDDAASIMTTVEQFIADTLKEWRA